MAYAFHVWLSGFSAAMQVSVSWVPTHTVWLPDPGLPGTLYLSRKVPFGPPEKGWIRPGYGV